MPAGFTWTLGFGLLQSPANKYLSMYPAFRPAYNIGLSFLTNPEGHVSATTEPPPAQSVAVGEAPASATPEHSKWLVDTGERLKTADGKTIEIWELRHKNDEAILSAWAKHFRNHYCSDDSIDFLRGKQSRKEYLENIKFPSDRNCATRMMKPFSQHGQNTSAITTVPMTASTS